MLSVWSSMKRSLECKVQPSDFHDPSPKKNVVTTSTTRRTKNKCPVSSGFEPTVSSGCLGPIPHVREAMNRSTSKRNMQEPQQNCPKSAGNKRLFTTIVHEVVRNKQAYELKISNALRKFVERVVPETTPGPGEHLLPLSGGLRNLNKPLEESQILSSDIRGVERECMVSLGSESYTCHECGEEFVNTKDVEAHHLSRHAVTELVEGDSSRNVVQLICMSGCLKSNNLSSGFERILKVNNLQKTISKFEKYREEVKFEASEVSMIQPRCVADGNELLRFYGTTTECLLGTNGSSSLCSSNRCCLCRILRHGFLFKKKKGDYCSGVFTASSSERALASVNMVDRNNNNLRKALIVCRVIAGRVLRSLENIGESDNQLEFDSLAGKVDLNPDIEELYSLNPKAILPCFVIICKP